MSGSTRRRGVLAGIVVLALVIIAVLLLLTRCGRTPRPTVPTDQPSTGNGSASGRTPGGEDTALHDVAEDLSPATLAAPPRVAAGAAFQVAWTGPGNAGDFVAIVTPDAPDDRFGSYRETDEGATLELTAPIEPGTYEVRYVTARSRSVLGRAPIEVEPVGAALEAPAEVVIGSAFEVRWTGPDNAGDYVTIVPRGAPDAVYASYADTGDGSPAALTAPIEAGEAEVRYVSGQGRVVLARRAIRVVEATAELTAPAEAVAGSVVSVAWTGPGNAGDYITVVPVGTPDGRYENYTDADAGSPLELTMPIQAGPAEIRYQTGQGHRVLARRAIRVVAARITLSAPEECRAGEEVSIEWTGPDNNGDYITIVPRGAPDEEYRAYADTRGGSPALIAAPDEAGEAEIRYVAGQDRVVLARRVIRVVR